MTTETRALPLGSILAGYRIDRILGQGGFGITYLATDAKLMRQVAIKEYYPREYASRDRTMTIQASGNLDDKEIFASGLRRFLQEGQLLARFEHPNIVAVRRFFEAHGTAYLVMDYCDGRPLDEIIRSQGLPTQDELERIWLPLLNGLEQVHKAGFLHRDIKPANIFMRTGGSPLLLDFGSAITTDSQFTRGVTTLVADGYSPIEQYDANGKQGPYTDIYGLAATLYRVVTGEKPQVSTGRILEDLVKPSAIVAKGKYAQNLLIAIDAGMAIRPVSRPQSVADWRELINKKSRPSISPRIEPAVKVEPRYDTQNSHNRKVETKSLSTTTLLSVIFVLFVLAVIASLQPSNENAKAPVSPAVSVLPIPTSVDSGNSPVKDNSDNEPKPPEPAVASANKFISLFASNSRAIGYSTGNSNEVEANKNGFEQCSKQISGTNDTCILVLSGNGNCLAISLSNDGGLGASIGSSSTFTAAEAQSTCIKNGGKNCPYPTETIFCSN